MSNKKFSKRPGRLNKRTAYSNQTRAEKNRERKLVRHLKKHPGDKQASVAIKKPRPKKSKPRSSMYPMAVYSEVTTPKGSTHTVVSYFSREMVAARAKFKRFLKALSFKEKTNRTVKKKTKEKKEDSKD